MVCRGYVGVLQCILDITLGYVGVCQGCFGVMLGYVGGTSENVGVHWGMLGYVRGTLGVLWGMSGVCWGTSVYVMLTLGYVGSILPSFLGLDVICITSQENFLIFFNCSFKMQLCNVKD